MNIKTLSAELNTVNADRHALRTENETLREFCNTLAQRVEDTRQAHETRTLLDIACERTVRKLRRAQMRLFSAAMFRGVKELQLPRLRIEWVTTEAQRRTSRLGPSAK
jgi:hypothetical protein